MNRTIISALVAAFLLFVAAAPAFAWGRGGFSAGGYRGGYVGGYRGGYVGGYRGFDAGAYRGGYVGGVEAGGYRGVDYGGYRAGEVGGYRVGEVGGYRGGYVGGVEAGRVGMATDFGFGHVAGVGGAAGFVTAGHYTTPYTASVLAARGAVVRGGYYRYGAFNPAWWAGHPGAWFPGGWDYGRAWGWATWPVLTGWLGWSAPPVYFDYGNSIVYQGDQVYLNGQPGPTAADYYQQAANLAQSAPAAPPAKDEWQPLGVFSLVQGQQADTSAVFQLAVNKAGVIGGNYYNVLTDTTLPVHGAVDKNTQRASWVVGDQKATVYDTGIYNLTREESPLLIHFGKDRTEQWLLIRIQDKDAKAPPAATTVAAPPPANVEGTAQVTVIVPPYAEVYFDGILMTETGAERTFYSPLLQGGVNYSYTVRARWTEGGRPVDQTRKVQVRAGARVRVDFTSPLP
jgi:uncharacterized protein (TIGR03000 family)